MAPLVFHRKSKHVHLTTVVKVKEFKCHSSPKWVIDALESSMSLFQQQWMASHSGGELSKFGNFPSTEWSLDHLDAVLCGWLTKDPQLEMHFAEDRDITAMSFCPGLQYTESDLLLDLCSLDEDNAEV
jgi:hypothetical protein